MAKVEMIHDPKTVEKLSKPYVYGKLIALLEEFQRSDALAMKYTPDDKEYSNIKTAQGSWHPAVKKPKLPMKVVSEGNTLYVIKTTPVPHAIENCDICRKRSTCCIYTAEGAPCDAYDPYGGERNA